MALVVKNTLVYEGDIKDAGSIPESGRSLGGGHVNPLQYPCLDNPMDRGAWKATVHRVNTELDMTEVTNTFTIIKYESSLSQFGRQKMHLMKF